MAPLAGFRVLDLTTSIAGPSCTMILSALGAEVVKVERPDGGDDTRTWGPPFWNGESVAFLSFNSGKRSLAIDVKSRRGKEAILQLAEGADVFVQNLRPGLAERLGFGFEALKKRNPRLVYCSIGAYGSKGPLAGEPGYDPLMQAASGIMSITGEAGRPPVRSGPSIVDQGTGLWAALGVLAALRVRDASGQAQLVDTSLYEVALNWVPYQLAGYFATGTTPGPMGSGISIIAPYEAFAASDGWVMIAAGNDKLYAALCSELGRPELTSDTRFVKNADRVTNRDGLVAAIGPVVAEDTVESWVTRLRAVGVPVAPVRDLSEVALDEQADALQIFQPVEHALGDGLRLVAPPLTMNGRRLELGTSPPTLGEHSRAVLTDAGFSSEEIDGMIGDGSLRAEGEKA